jgi:phosphatidylglycerol:prolipoprotein diacylglycerol transferase
MGMLLSVPMIVGGAWLIWRAQKGPPAATPA